MTPTRQSRSKSRRGFTLLEVAIAMSLFSVVAIGATNFFIQSMQSYHYDAGKLLVNRDIRNFTSEMTDNAAYANYFMIFPSFNTRTITTEVGDSSSGFTTVTTDASVNDGESGDMLVLVYKDPADEEKISRIVGYFRSANNPLDPDGEGPVRRFQLDFATSVSGNVWDLLPATNTSNDQPEVVEISKGLADGKLFYNFHNRSVMIKGKIFHRGNLTKRATNTYNFTVSPRG